MTNKKVNEKGFTIIEVVLVLAIAGLIFLIVFLALPQLQRSRRDTQRRNDVGRLLASLETYAGNHDGSYATAFNNLNTNLRDAYLTANGSQFTDPTTGNSYSLAESSGVPTSLGTINIAQDSVCTGTSGGDRSIAARIDLEEGDYCQDNQ